VVGEKGTRWLEEGKGKWEKMTRRRGGEEPKMGQKNKRERGGDFKERAGGCRRSVAYVTRERRESEK